LKENNIFLGIFLGNKYVFATPTPLENFALPWKKVCGRPWTHKYFQKPIQIYHFRALDSPLLLSKEND